MRELSISEFKATCLAVLKRVQRTGESVVVTRRGEPIAEVIPPSRPAPVGWLGSLLGSGEVCGDLVAPAAGIEAWEILDPKQGAT